MLYGQIVLICMMHIGIALSMNNTVLLSLVACIAWCIFLPEGVGINLLTCFSPSHCRGMDTGISSDKGDDKIKENDKNCGTSRH